MAGIRKKTKRQQVGAPVSDDGLITNRAGLWTLRKYDLVSYYEGIFATGMKERWDKRVYVELYCGSGRTEIPGRGIVESSPMLALGIQDPFDRYVFCDSDEVRLNALRERVTARFGNSRDVHFVQGGVNENAATIAGLIPGGKTLSFCFADPYDAGLHFQTVETLASGRKIDFLILLALHSDAKRGLSVYLDEDHRKLTDFLGREDWRERWRRFETETHRPLVEFLALEYVDRMASIGYVRTELADMVQIRSEDKNLPLYYLAFFAKDERGRDFWKQTLKYSRQPPLF